MKIDGYPRLGTPKQNAFIIKLGGALGFATLQEAANAGLNRPPATALADPFTMADASTVITVLLEKCAAAGIQTYSGGKKKRKGGKRRPAPAAEAAPLLPPPAAPEQGRTVKQALADLGEAAKMLIRRGCTEAEVWDATGLGYTDLASTPTDKLCAELERRGLPANFLLTDADAVAVAKRALVALAGLYHDEPMPDGEPRIHGGGLLTNSQQDELRAILTDAGALE